jgi:hypothetical protein
MCNLYSITTNQAAIAGLFRRLNRYVGNLAPMPGVFPDYPAPVIRNAGDAEEMVLMRWGMPPPPQTGGPPVTNIRNTTSPHVSPPIRCYGMDPDVRPPAVFARSPGRTIRQRASPRRHQSDAAFHATRVLNSDWER